MGINIKDHIKEYKARIDERIRYRNFSEDADIIKENNIDENLSLYIVKNKNNVTFQKVPGMAWIGVGKLGYIRGDKSRPVMLGTSDFDVKIKSGKFSAGDLAPGTNRVTSNFTVLIDFEWDIQLQVTRGSEMAIETKLIYIKVL